MKVIPPQTIQDIKDSVDQSKRILIICHRGPDGDCLGSMLALFSALKFQLHKEVKLLCHDLVPLNMRFLPNFFEVQTDINFKKEHFDLIIFVDVAEKKQIGLAELVPSIFRSTAKKINIDHHKESDTSKGMGDINLIVQSAATAEIIFHLFKIFHWQIDSQIATCLLTGIYTDTGSFQHDNATEKTFQIASELILKGARLNLIIKNTFNYKPIPRLRLWGRALSRIQRDQKEGINVSVITKEDLKEVGADLEDLEGVVSVINTIPNTKATILLSERDENEIKGSIRTEADDVDVSQIASLFGGGGHKKASGFSLPGRLERTGGGSWRIVK